MPEPPLDALGALAQATRAARTPEERRQAAMKVAAERSDELASELAEIDSLRQQAAELERVAQQRADEALEVRARFMANISHELRTPLNGIIGYLEILSEGIGGPLTAAQQRQIHRIRAGAFRLKEMIEEILTFSRLEAGGETVEMEDTDVAIAVNEVVALVGPLMEDKALTFNVVLPETPQTIRTDSGKLRQILLNLLSNAQKYTDRGQVDLRVEQDGQTTTITVRDTGRGIPTQDHEKIFGPFQRLPTPDYRGGTGLGLSVSRSLTTLLGGDITVQSEVGHGSTLVVRIPSRPRS